MKILLLTDNHRYKDKGTNLILNQLLGFLPSKSLCCYIINPNQDGSKTIANPILQTIPSRITAKATLNDLVSFVKEQNVTAILCILNSIDVLNFITDILDKIKLPIYTHIIEPPKWLTDQKKEAQKKKEEKFQAVLNNSAAVATASFNLAEEYQRKYNINALPIVFGLDPTLCLNPKLARTESESKSDTFTIGVLGGMYLYEAWGNLLLALEFFKWKIGNKKIKIRYLGKNLYVIARNADIEFLGERTEVETLSLLAETDMLYYTNSFVEEQAYAVSNNTLPEDLYYYLAAGCPILAHAPEYDAVSKFLKKYQAAIEVSDFEKSSLYQAIERCMWDTEYYEEIAKNGRQAFIDNLTMPKVKSQFQKFLNYTNSHEKAA